MTCYTWNCMVIYIMPRGKNNENRRKKQCGQKERFGLEQAYFTTGWNTMRSLPFTATSKAEPRKSPCGGMAKRCSILTGAWIFRRRMKKPKLHWRSCWNSTTDFSKTESHKPEPKGSGGRTGKISIGVSYTRKRRNFYVFSVCLAACYPCFCMVIPDFAT